MTTRRRNPGYRISGPYHLAEDGPPRWEDADPIRYDQLAIGWSERTHLEATVVECEGLEFRLFTEVPLSHIRPDALDDFVYIWEESLTADTAAPVRAAEAFFRTHGPLYLCDAHGLPQAHTREGCPKTHGDRLSAIIELARTFATALQAAEALRAGEPVDQLIAELACPEPEPPPLLRLLPPEKREQLERHIETYPSREWRLLKAWLARFAADCEAQRGVLPHVVSQLHEACDKKARRWLCEDPECSNFYYRTRSDRRYCGEEECDRTRIRGRVGILPYCPVCKQHMGKGRLVCSTCERLNLMPPQPPSPQHLKVVSPRRKRLGDGS